MTLSPSELARMIDHTLLKPEATEEQIEQLCREALDYQFASVCVNSVYVPLCARRLQSSPVRVCTVVGFPLGASLTEVKAYEAARAIELGAAEVDMVLHVGTLRDDEKLGEVYNDISAVVAECQPRGVLTKVIVETALLTDEQKVFACNIAKQAGADFVKTSTGFSSGGATVADVRLMRQTVGSDMGVKASGGIRTLADALAMIDAGANRLGMSAGVVVLRELQGQTTDSTSTGSY